tara:strand:- start:580 stop:1677 length:1098 start_codon:yes stop_codon:yes gene_type:complete
MSLKKDNFTKFDKKVMHFAINLADINKGLSGTNPSVGCVIVKNKKIVSYGVTNINGTPHAETIALKKNKKNNSGSTIYLTLEPCSHYGKTPPCTNAIARSKIKKVYFSINDLDKRVLNKSKNKLNEKKIVVKKGLLSNETKKLYKNYNFIKKNNFPYIVGKIACSSNFYILKNKEFITNEHSRNVCHLLRYKNQGILTSYKTVNSDDPILNCRLNGLDNFSPIRLIIDKDLKIYTKSNIVKTSNKYKTFVFHNSNNQKKIIKLKSYGLNLIKQEILKDGYFDLNKLFKNIYDLGIHNVLVECGKNLTYKILKSRLFNEFYLFKSNKKIANKGKISVLNINRNLKFFKNKIQVNTFLDNDKLTQYF